MARAVTAFSFAGIEFQSLNDRICIFNSAEEKTLANQKIAEGDYVLIYLDARRTYMIKMQAGQTFHTHKGYLKLDELIGKDYGEPIKSSLGIYFTTLKPSLTDYIMKSSRNTQIIYPKDAALIVMFSGIGPGSRVAESGTGTGSLTTALAHYVGSTGKVYTYELRPEFQKNAAKNLERSKLIDHVEMKSGNIVDIRLYGEGFGCSGFGFGGSMACCSTRLRSAQAFRHPCIV